MSNHIGASVSYTSGWSISGRQGEKKLFGGVKNLRKTKLRYNPGKYIKILLVSQ